MVHVITASDRQAFKRCRRAWDLGSRLRQAWEPDGAAPQIDLAGAVRAALAVWYFPGMWAWDRAIVRPLAFEAYHRLVATWPPTGDAAAAEGERLLGRYFDWAPAVDRFTPLRVESDFQVAIPDPGDPVLALVAADGAAVHYAGRIDLLVADETGGNWLVVHRVGPAWAAPDELVLDERGAAGCWAWAQCFIGTEIAGAIYNELRTDADSRRGGGSFRRTPVRRDLVELERIRRTLGLEARDMIDPALAVYPAPSWPVCSTCAFRPPCMAMNAGADADALLHTSYRRRPPFEQQPGRLGGATWSTGRGAAPPTFGRHHDGPTDNRERGSQ
jgi:hypothetical protein